MVVLGGRLSDDVDSSTGDYVDAQALDEVTGGGGGEGRGTTSFNKESGGKGRVGAWGRTVKGEELMRGDTVM